MPVAQALAKLQSIYLVPISYEEIPYFPITETTVDDTGRIVAKSVALSFTYQPPAIDATSEERKALAAKAITEVLKSYEGQQGQRTYRVAETEQGFDVIGTGFRDENVVIDKNKLVPLLDTPVSISAEKAPAWSVFAEILQQIKDKTGQHVVSSTSYSERITVTVNATKEPARDVLRKFIAQIALGYESKPTAAGGTTHVPTTQSWELLCRPNEPNKPVCGLLVHAVAPDGRGVVNMGAASH
jgi:hypothetical protein